MFTSAFPIVSTRDMPRALGFYRDLLGGKITYQFPPEGEPGYVGLEIGPSHIGIGLNPDAPTGAQRIALWLYADDCDVAVAHVDRKSTRLNSSHER